MNESALSTPLTMFALVPPLLAVGVVTSTRLPALHQGQKLSGTGLK
jgi:hypothetical protein